MSEEPKVKTKISQKTKVNTTLAVILAIFVISSVSFTAFAYFGDPNEIKNPSLFTPSLTTAGDIRLTQGTVVHLVVGDPNTDSVELTTVDRGHIKVQLLSVDEENNWAKMHYWKYDRQGNLESEREVSFGPQDVGWEIEVLKIGTERATLTVPLRPGQSF